MSNILECRSLSFNYGDGNSKTSVLKNLDFRVKTEERIAIIGQSGCGKSTLLNLLAGLDMPSEGEVLIDNKNIASMKERQTEHAVRKCHSQIRTNHMDMHKSISKGSLWLLY